MIDLDSILTRARAAKERADKADPKPWRLEYDERHNYMRVLDADAAEVVREVDYCHPLSLNFIASARTDVPQLAQDVEMLVAEYLKVRNSLYWLESQVIFKLKMPDD